MLEGNSDQQINLPTGFSEAPVCSGLVVSALDFRSGDRWFETSLCHRVFSLEGKTFSLRYTTLSTATNYGTNWLLT